MRKKFYLAFSSALSASKYSHKKQKDILETRAIWLIFLLEFGISGVAVLEIHYSSKH